MTNLNQMVSTNKTAYIELLLFLAIFFSSAYFHHPVEYDNSKSRFFLISSIVDFKTLDIDAYHAWTQDKSYYNGHYYSNKAPGGPLLGVPVYWILTWFKNNTDPPLSLSDRYIIRLVTTAIPFAITGILLFRIGFAWCNSERRALLMVLAYSFGSIAFQHSTLFSGHQLAASFSFFSFYLIYSLSAAKTEKDTILKKSICAFSAGLFAGIGALADYTAMFLAVIISLYVLISVTEKRYLLLFFGGGFICIIILTLYNYSCFGSIFSLSYGHQATEAFKKGSESGFLGVSIPDPKALFQILFSPSHGLFFIMPVFIYSIVGFCYLFQKKEFTREGLILLSIVTGYLAINAGFYAWHGGWSFGPRYIVPMLPFLALPMVFSPVENKFFSALLFLSVFQVGISVAGFPHVPEVIRNPIFEIILPCMKYGYFAQNIGNLFSLRGVWSIIPLLLFSIIAVAMLLSKIQKKDVMGRQHPQIVKILSLLWFCIIVVVLACYRTPNQRLVHGNRSLLLMDAAIMMDSDKIKEKAISEMKLSNDLE